MKVSTQTIIRLVEPSDIAKLARLLDVWNVGLENGQERDLLNQLTLVAERGGQTLGCISALVGPSDLAYVDNLVVDPAVGNALITYSLLTTMERLLARLGWRHIQACVSLDRPELIAYAERLGYIDFGLHHVIGKPLFWGSNADG
jgi:N-acetylglutamate synthase-like GNAT family acetyltransferase